MKTLLDKYRFIRTLRADHPRATREMLQALARAFPGALRELELLPPQALKARIDALESGEPKWAEPMRSYHANLRRILLAKQKGDLSDLSEREREELKLLPRGRISQLALAWTSAQTAIATEELRAMLSPLVHSAPAGAGKEP